ncbi:MAG: RsmE family RNA methyltransferase [Aquificaceae bacterium]|nr:RsmE family RNA methyltransferase [Aquificaceae bacterium]
MERLICTGKKGDFFTISGSEFKHLKALRINKGEEIEVFCEDRLFLVRLYEIKKDHALCTIVREIKVSLPKPEVFLYQCVPTELGLMDEVVDRSSQAGALKLTPILCKRGFQVREKVEEKIERWKRISLASFKQCKRPKPMEISPPIRLEDLKPTVEVPLLLENFTGNLTIREINLKASSYSVVVGPEGGFTKEEVELLKSRGFLPLLLKPYIFRSEMAGAIAVALIMNLAGI